MEPVTTTFLAFKIIIKWVGVGAAHHAGSTTASAALSAKVSAGPLPTALTFHHISVGVTLNHVSEQMTINHLTVQPTVALLRPKIVLSDWRSPEPDFPLIRPHDMISASTRSADGPISRLRMDENLSWQSDVLRPRKLLNHETPLIHDFSSSTYRLNI